MDYGTRRFCEDMRDNFDEVTSKEARAAVKLLAETAITADDAVQRLRREAENRYVSCCDCVAWKGPETTDVLGWPEDGHKHVIRECRNWPASGTVSQHATTEDEDKLERVALVTIWTRTPDCGGCCYGIRFLKED